MHGKRMLVIPIALALLLACIIALRLQRDKPVDLSIAVNRRPGLRGSGRNACLNSGRAPWEIPGVILGYDHGPRFDQASPGAQVAKIAPDHIELSADGGWDLLIESDGEGRLAQETHIAFPVKLGGRPLNFNLPACRFDQSLSYS